MKMRLWVVFLLILCVTTRPGRGLLSKIFDVVRNDGNGNDDVGEEEDPCESVKVMPRIVGGSPVKSETSTPYIAAVGERLSNGSIAWYCGGSILSQQYILTAAHCLGSRNADVVRVGSLHLNKKSCENDYGVADLLVHPQYKAPKSYNDIAIIKLKGRIKYADNIRPVCIAERDDAYDGRKARVMGWGAEEVGGDGTQKLQKVEVEIVSNAKCDEAYQNSSISTKTFPDGVKNGQLCAGSRRGGKDACQGDSGGPLVLSDKEGITRQIGVVSTGAGCGAKVYPGVYSRVSTYSDWIRESVKKEKSSVNPARDFIFKASEEKVGEYRPGIHSHQVP